MYVPAHFAADTETVHAAGPSGLVENACRVGGAARSAFESLSGEGEQFG